MPHNHRGVPIAGNHTPMPRRMPRLEEVIANFTQNGTGDAADTIAEAREDRADGNIDYYGGGSPAQDIIQSALAQHQGGHDIISSNANPYGKSHDYLFCSHPSCQKAAEEQGADWDSGPSLSRGQWANGQYYNWG
jgi:hypothetical protein